MSNAVDPFNIKDDDSPLIFRQQPYGSNGQIDRSIEVYGPDAGTRPFTAEDAIHAIAGVMYLWQRPGQDLHGYTEYVDEVRLWLNARVAAATDYEAGATDEIVVAYNRTTASVPYPGPKVEHTKTQEDLDAALQRTLLREPLGIPVEEMRERLGLNPTTETKGPRSLSEILGQ